MLKNLGAFRLHQSHVFCHSLVIVQPWHPCLNVSIQIVNLAMPCCPFAALTTLPHVRPVWQ